MATELDDLDITTELTFYDSRDDVLATGAWTPNTEGVKGVSVGDTVVGYSRGKYRVATVTKVGRKNVTIAYRTQGGVDQMRRLAAAFRSRDYDQVLRDLIARYERNRDFARQEADPATAKYWDKYRTDDETARYEREAAKTDAELRAEAEAEVAERRREGEGFLRLFDEQGPVALATVTTKVLNADDLLV